MGLEAVPSRHPSILLFNGIASVWEEGVGIMSDSQGQDIKARVVL
jgi:hypothetical protein